MSNVQCNHATLTKLGGALHPSGKDYYCKDCGQQFRADSIEITGHFGAAPQASEPGER